MGGYGAYLLALYVLRQASSASFSSMRNAQLAAFVGGAIFTFSPYHMAHLLGHMQLIALEWIPFYALAVLVQIDKAAVSGQPSAVKRQPSNVSRQTSNVNSQQHLPLRQSAAQVQSHRSAVSGRAISNL